MTTLGGARRGYVRTLPYLRRVAYLESIGGVYQYIDTDVQATDVFRFYIEFQPLDPVAGFESFFGNDNDDFDVDRRNLDDGLRIWVRRIRNELSFTAGKMLILEISPPKVILDGSIVRNNLNVDLPLGTLSSTVRLFNRIVSASSGLLPNVRIAKCDIFGIESKLRSFIPVLDLSGRPAMYDEVSGQFFYNQGTGEFTWGEIDPQAI